MSCPFAIIFEASQKKAFSVAASMPEDLRQEIRQQFDLLLETAAPLSEAIEALGLVASSHRVANLGWGQN
jgi:hypothetical protein